LAINSVGAVGQRPPRPRRVAKAHKPVLGVANTPLDDRRQRTPNLLGDPLARLALSRQQHDPRPLDHPHLRPRRGNDPLKLRTIRVAHLNPLAHALHSHR